MLSIRGSIVLVMQFCSFQGSMGSSLFIFTTNCVVQDVSLNVTEAEWIILQLGPGRKMVETVVSNHVCTERRVQT